MLRCAGVRRTVPDVLVIARMHIQPPTHPVTTGHAAGCTMRLRGTGPVGPLIHYSVFSIQYSVFSLRDLFSIQYSVFSILMG